MSSDLTVTYGGVDYLDRTRALVDGTVRPAGVNFRYIAIGPGDLFRRVAQHCEFDAAEMSLSTNRPPALSDGSGRVRRLFPNWVEMEQDYYRRTGLFPIMHVVVMRRDLYQPNRWLAASLLEAFVKAQRLGWRRLFETGSLAVMLPWLPSELEQIGQTFGAKFWQYGFAENFETIQAFCQFHFEQGLTSRLMTPQELFAEEVHESPTSGSGRLYDFSVS